MTRFIALIRLTCLEVVSERIYRIVLSMLLVLPWLLLIPASLFMLDIGKVFIDLLFASQHAWLLIYLFFLAAPLISRDIEEGSCQLFLTLPMPRSHYLWARFTGLVMAIAPLMLAWLASSTIALQLAEHNWPGYVLPDSSISFATGAVLILLPYLALTATLFLIAAGATGLSETTVFLFSVWLLSWSLPPVLGALQQEEVAAKTPAWTSTLLHIVNQLLPDLTSSRISLLLAHAKPLEPLAIVGYCTHHIAYALLALLLAALLFKRRDLT